MKLRLRKQGLPEFLYIILSFLITYHFFYLFPYPYFMTAVLWIFRRAILCTMIGLGYWGVFRRFRVESRWLNWYCFLVCFSVVILFVYSVFIYPLQELGDTLKVACIFMLPILSVVFFECFYKGYLHIFLSTMNIICLIWHLLMVVHTVIYMTRGVLLFDLKSYFIGDSVYIRDNSIRITMGVMSQFMIIYNFSYLYKNTKKTNFKWLYHLILFILGLYCLVIVSKTRADQAYVLIAIAAIVLIGGKTNRSRFLTVVMTMVGIYIIINTDIITKITEVFSSANANTNSVVNRLYAYRYYGECIRNNPFWGHGFPMTTNIAYPYYGVEHGALGRAYYSDVGIVGLIANIGMFAIPIFIYPMIRFGKIVWKISRKVSWNEIAFPAALFVYLFVSSITLITTDTVRMFQFAFALAYYEYINLLYERKGSI